MPEGDTVFRQAALLRRALAGQTLRDSDFRVPALANVDLAGRTVDDVVSRGKHLLIRIGEASIQSHLKMEGVWHVYPRTDGVRASWRRPWHTARCVLTVPDAQAVGFSLGQLRVLSAAQEKDFFASLGPDLLGPDWNAERACRLLAAQPDRAIGVALLDQRNLAGVGNVFRSEICFLAGVRSETPVREVADLPGVVDLAHRLLQSNRSRARRVTTGAGDTAARHWVYGRARQACLRCGSRIIEYDVGERGADRSVYVCPRCQPR